MAEPHSIALLAPGPTDKVSLAYAGAFRDEVTAQLIALVEGLPEVADWNRAYRQRLAFIMVEVFQNIVRHRWAVNATSHPGSGQCSFQFHDAGPGQRIISINPVLRAAAEKLEQRLGGLRGLNAERLKELYLSGLRGVRQSGQRGAGLGIIEMTRRSGHPLAHAFRDADGEAGPFLLLARCGEERTADAQAMAEAWAVHDHLLKGRVHLVYRGPGTAGIQEALARIVEVELANDPRAVRIRQLLLAAWALSSGPDEGGMDVLLAREGPGWRLVVGHEQPVMRADRARADLSRYVGMERRALDTLYRELLLADAARKANEDQDLLEMVRGAATVELIERDGGRGMRRDLFCMLFP